MGPSSAGMKAGHLEHHKLVSERYTTFCKTGHALKKQLWNRRDFFAKEGDIYD